MTFRLFHTALWRKRGMVSLAILAVAIGGSVAGALLHISRDISQKLTRELRTLGPNLLLLPAGSAGDAAFLDERTARARLRAGGLEGAALLFVTADVGGRRVPVVGADLAMVQKLHPAWAIGAGERRSLIGMRLARRLGVTPGQLMRATFATPTGPRSLEWPAGAAFESGRADDEAWGLPLDRAQELAGRPREISLMQVRLDDPAGAEDVARRLELQGAVRAQVLHALSSTEATLLERTRRL